MLFDKLKKFDGICRQTKSLRLPNYSRIYGLPIGRHLFSAAAYHRMVFHNVRDKLGLSLNTYVVIVCIHKLSSSDRTYPFCVMSKTDLAKFLRLGERTIYRSTIQPADAGWIERAGYGLRATDKWVRTNICKNWKEIKLNRMLDTEHTLSPNHALKWNKLWHRH